MTDATTTAFALRDPAGPKADAALIAEDERHFAAIVTALQTSVADLSARLDAARRAPGGAGQAALDRDQEVHRLTAQLTLLRRSGVDLCLGRMVSTEHERPVYIGRAGLADAGGRRLLVDWRTPVAEPFFAATHAQPMGLTSRRRYHWASGRVSDYWDEVFDLDGLQERAALDDQSAFIASLGSARSPRMRDVLATITADQDAIIRAGSRGALVVDGGPGTGKTVVALHRTAYLLHADPRLGHRRGGVLVVGPHQPYLSYVADVLPSLGEEGVQLCTPRDLVAEGATAAEEPDDRVAHLKSVLDPVAVVEAAVALYEEPPTQETVVTTPWSQVRLSAADWAAAFTAPDPGTPHNEAREQILEELVALLVDRHAGSDDGDDGDGDLPAERVRRCVLQDRELRATLHRAWPLLDPAELVGDLWSVPAYLRRCAPSLGPDEVRALRRQDPLAWTVPDLPFLDAARQRLGDRDAPARRRRADAAAATELARRSRVVEDLVAAHEHDDGEGVAPMLRHRDLQQTLVEAEPVHRTDPDRLAGPFAHLVVDEAQELTDAQWRMLLARCPSKSLTIVGDRAQARGGFTETWAERLHRVGLDRVEVATLSVNYRTPAEIMAEAEPVIRSVLPDANIPTSVRSTGKPVVHGRAADLRPLLDRWLAEHAGTACVIGDPSIEASTRVRSLSPQLVKGLEFDLVVLIDPHAFGEGITAAVDHYVAMTRATQQLVILTSS